MKKTLMLILLACCCAPTFLNAQILNRVLKSTENRLRYRAEQMIIDKASDAIARAVMRRFEREIDQALQEAYAKQDAEARERGETPTYADYSDFLSAMNKKADVPESYAFDVRLFMEISEKGEKPQDMVYFFSEDGKYFGFEGENEGKKTMTIVDLEKDVIVMYYEENGEKKATALPNMMKAGMKMAEQQVAETSEEMAATFRATGNSKTVAGYNCQEYEYLQDKDKTLTYISNEVGVSWSQAFAKSFSQFLPNKDEFPAEVLSGFALETIQYDKKGKEAMRMTTTEVKKENYNINNSEWNFQDFAAMAAEEKK